MLQPSCLVFIITLWFSLELICKASMTTPKDNFFPLPTNLKIHLYPGIINVTWDCNITKSMEGHPYHIMFHYINKTINISKCFYDLFVTDDLDFILHKGLKINISSNSEWKEEFSIPEGKNNTAAENLQCNVYNVSIVNCSWTVGREAPKDTQYTLAFRQTPYESHVPNPKQDRVYAPCANYRTDSIGRQIGCILKSPKINFSVSVYVQLVGSSSKTSIQFFDKLLILDRLVILDPPRNVCLNYNLNELEITWEAPETYSNLPSNYFTYCIKINGKEHKTKEQSYKTSNLHMNEKVNVSVRAGWKYLQNKNWSRWSEPLIIEPASQRFTPNHHLLVLGIVTFAILFLLILLCHRFQVWKRLFPKIPKPVEKFFETVEQNELMEENMKKNLPEEDEECICLQITEVPHKEQPHN